MNPSEGNGKNMNNSSGNVQFKTPLPHKFTRILETPKTPELLSAKFAVSRTNESKDPLQVKLIFDNTDQLKPVEDLLNSVKQENEGIPFKPSFNSFPSTITKSQELHKNKEILSSRRCLALNPDGFNCTPKETFCTSQEQLLSTELHSSEFRNHEIYSGNKCTQPSSTTRTPICSESRSAQKSSFAYPRHSSKTEEQRKQEFWNKIRSLAQRQLAKTGMSSDDEDEEESKKENADLPGLSLHSHLPLPLSHREPGFQGSNSKTIASRETPRNFVPHAKQKRTPLSTIWQPPSDSSKEGKLYVASDSEKLKQQQDPQHHYGMSTEPNKISKPVSNASNECGASRLSQTAKDNCNTLTVNNKNYRVISVLGKGGTSKVLEAFEEESRALLAIKVIDLSMVDQGSKIAYRKEVDFLIKLKNCQRVIHMIDYEYKEMEQMLYIVMEKGDSDMVHILREVASRKELFAEWQVRFYWSQMLKAVKEIHDKGIIHADLKPANFIMVKGELKLIDFGIASALHSDMTSVVRDSQVGTINYMSPESLIASSSPSQPGIIKVRQKSDVWSLGCILYNLTYGHTPFQSIKNLVGKMQAISNPNYQISFPPCKDVFLLDVLKKCLERDPTKRPSIQDLLSHPYLTLPSGNVQFLMESLKLACSPNTLLKVSQALQPAKDS